MLLLLLAGGWWWFVAGRHRKSQPHGNVDDAVEESVEMMDNPMPVAAAARAASLASFAGTGNSPVIYSIPMEEDGETGSGDAAGAGGGRVPNPMYQSADPRNSTVARAPNPMYQPAANNNYDAGVTSNSTTPTPTTTSNCGGSGYLDNYHDADSVPNAGNAVYATPADGDDADEAKNLPNLVQVYSDGNGCNHVADGYGGTAA